MAIQGKKLSDITEQLTEVKGTERIYVADGTTGKYLLLDALATKQQASAKLDTATYNSEKANFATKAEIGDINTALDAINGEEV